MEKVMFISREKTGNDGLWVPVTSQMERTTAHPVSGPYDAFCLPWFEPMCNMTIILD